MTEYPVGKRWTKWFKETLNSFTWIRCGCRSSLHRSSHNCKLLFRSLFLFFTSRCTGLDSVRGSKRSSQWIPLANNVRQLLGSDCQGSWEPSCVIWRSTEDFSLVLYGASNKDRGMQSSITKGEKLWVFTWDTNPPRFWLSGRIPLSLFFDFFPRQGWLEEVK